MSYTKTVTEKDLQEAIWRERQASGLSQARTKRGGCKAGLAIIKPMAEIWMGRFAEDLDAYPEDSREHKEAALAIGVIPATLYELAPDGGWKPKNPSRHRYTRIMRDLLIDLAAMEANKNAEEMAAAYLIATNQKYAREHVPAKTYDALYKKPGNLSRPGRPSIH